MRKTGSGMRGWVEGFGGRHPLFVAALVAAACVALADWHPWWGVLAGAVLLWRGGCVFGGLAARLGVVAVRLGGGRGFHLAGWHRGGRRKRELAAAPGGRMQARVLKDAQGSERFWVAPAGLLDGGRAGVKVWWEGSGEVPVAGSVVTARGNFGPLPEAAESGGIRPRGMAPKAGRGGDVSCGVGGGDRGNRALAALGAKIRHGFRDAGDGRAGGGFAGSRGHPRGGDRRATAGCGRLDRGIPQQRDFACVFGERPACGDGGQHRLAGVELGWACRGGGRWSVLLPLIFGYSWITGNSAPAVRSAWMAAVFLGAFVFRRRPDLLNALGAVLLAAMLWDGRLLFQPGVQLSYGVVAAIAVGTAWAAKTFAWMAVPELYLPTQLMSRWQTFWLRLRQKTAQSLSVSLAAGVGSAPLTAFHFGLVTPVSVLAGLVLVPLVFVLLVGGVAGGGAVSAGAAACRVA